MSAREFMESFCLALVKEGMAAPGDLHGYSESEIAETERVMRRRLPAYYKEFLRAIGRGAGSFMRGTYLFPKRPTDFVSLNQGAVRLMLLGRAEHGLPEDAFVFGDHQGYQYWYFLTRGAGDDPPVFYYHENRSRAERISASFSEFLAKMLAECIEQEKALRAQLEKRDAARAAFKAALSPPARPEQSG